MKTTLGWWVSRLKALGIQSTTYNKYPVSRLMQNKWHLTFLERFSQNHPTSEVIWVKMFFPYLWTPLVDLDGWHLFLTVRANRIEGGAPHTHTLRSGGGFAHVILRQSGPISTSDIWKRKSSFIAYGLSEMISKRTQTHWINLWINCSIVFLSF